MKAIVGNLGLDAATVFGMFVGLALLLVGFLFAELRYLAIPGLALALPSLVYGMR
jgi:hypothetical protein